MRIAPLRPHPDERASKGNGIF
ncbi:protein of unknown function [Magnetospirillum sp. XM-1]|nr:protein of unknown function [Magnetospirillum sp. XM-1]